MHNKLKYTGMKMDLNKLKFVQKVAKDEFLVDLCVFFYVIGHVCKIICEAKCFD